MQATGGSRNSRCVQQVNVLASTCCAVTQATRVIDGKPWWA
jgi:hypothetical protein